MICLRTQEPEESATSVHEGRPTDLTACSERLCAQFSLAAPASRPMQLVLEALVVEPERSKTPRGATYYRVLSGPRAASAPRCRAAEPWQSKTERWREAGTMRWPPAISGPERAAPEVPLRQYKRQMQAWEGELWARSLRKKERQEWHLARSMPRCDKEWIDRPVATGKYALDHMRGSRYVWGSAPRPCLT